MSDSDSFINEVSEELRRDRFYHLLRRYGWIAIAVVVVLVGGAAVNEYRKAQARAAAEAFGDSIVAALAMETPDARRDALSDIDGEGAQAALLSMLAADTLDDDTAQTGVTTALADLAGNTDLPEVYRHLAALKYAMLAQDTASPQDVQAALQPLLIPGAPYRLLALEQMALSKVADGQSEAALEELQMILADGAVTPDLRDRVEQLIVALGGSTDAA